MILDMCNIPNIKEDVVVDACSSATTHHACVVVCYIKLIFNLLLC